MDRQASWRNGCEGSWSGLKDKTNERYGQTRRCSESPLYIYHAFKNAVICEGGSRF